MSALRIIKLRPGASRALACGAGCRRANNPDHPRSPTHRVFIAGWHAADLCKRCQAEWKRAWEGEQVTLRIEVDPWKSVYLIENPEVIESAMWGPLLRGRYCVEGEQDRGFDIGVFRMDRVRLIERADEQLELRKAA